MPHDARAIGPQPCTELETEISEVLASSTSSHWLKTSLSNALARDCVDAASDAEVLAGLLGRRCDALLERR